MADNAASHCAVVSFDDEPLILVDTGDNVLGYESKNVCHDGDGLLHRAFSIFLFDRAANLLLQRRSADKRLWPGYWSNSCCSHPRRGETDSQAAERRIREELGIAPPLHYLFKFRYQVADGDRGAEHELCSIYAAVSAAAITANRNEIDATRWIDPAALDDELALYPDRYTPWLALEWPRIRRELWPNIETILSE